MIVVREPARGDSGIASISLVLPTLAATSSLAVPSSGAGSRSGPTGLKYSGWRRLAPGRRREAWPGFLPPRRIHEHRRHHMITALACCPDKRRVPGNTPSVVAAAACAGDHPARKELA